MIFASRDLPSNLSDRARFNLWQDIFDAEIAPVQYFMSADVPFDVTFSAAVIGPLVCASTVGTICGATRSPIQAGGDDHYTLQINIGSRAMGGTYRRRDVDIAAGGAMLIASEEQALVGGAYNGWINLRIPRTIFDASFAGAEGRQGRIIGPDHEAFRLLRHYLRLVEGPRVPVMPALIDHVATTIIDLTGLATGARGDDAELAGTRGLRRARLEAVIDRIRRDFTDPALSAQSVGQAMGLSARYVQDLLAETGTTLSDRVLELRLQHARKLLATSASKRISEIILASGFSDISYFNRCFRRRFGCTPSAAR